MPNILDANGLQIASLSEIVDALVLGLQQTYGDDINVNPNTPDGQLINIFAQADIDMLETLLDVYNIFFVDNSYGVNLDQLVALNGISRKPGSFTEVYVEVTVSGALNLPGLDTTTPFTVADDSGNQYRLKTTYVFGAAGTASLLFEAALLGQVQVTDNTITNIITTTLGVTGVNNPSFSISTTGDTTTSDPTITGIPDTTGMRAGMDLVSAAFPAGTKVLSVDSPSQITATNDATSSGTVGIAVSTVETIVGDPEETDIQLKIRRAKSFHLQTVGPSDSIRAAILEVADVSDCYVAENNTGSPVSGVPAHGVWIIVNGGADAEIGQAIYAKKMGGCDMKGDETYVVSRQQGNTFTAQWDVALPQDLFVRATLNPRIPGQVFDLTTDKAALAAALLFKLGASPAIGDVVQAMFAIEPNAVLSTVNVSENGTDWVDIISPSDLQHYFTLSAANITLTQA